VAEETRDSDHVDSVREQQRRGRMAQVVETDDQLGFVSLVTCDTSGAEYRQLEQYAAGWRYARMPYITDLSSPLRDDELDRLQSILLERVDEDVASGDRDEGVLNVSELDGLLTAVVSGPVTITPSRWLPAVWGDFEPAWNSLEDYQEFMSLVLRHMNDIAASLVDEPETFEPMYLENVASGDAVVVVDEWCAGYVRGVDLAADEWCAASPDIVQLLAPIRAFTASTDWLAHELPETEAAKLRDAIVPNVRALHAYWLARRAEGARDLVRQGRTSLRVGRNEPCPCGSGKKYKKCCLQ
jgi:uncharacterized protein